MLIPKKRDISLRGKIIYSVYLRNHTPEGTMAALEGDLDRIKALGTDIIWLLPIHPIGKVKRKGSLGSPYSISDYRAINPEYGTMDDFRHLVDAIHARGMLCIIDVVYNHTSHDSVLFREHPEYFFRKEDGSLGNRYGDWTDVIDLDYSHEELWDYQIETLLQWAEIVDGFRCDVASAVPVAFWNRAVEAVEKVRPGAIWLAETVYPINVRLARENGYPIATDIEMYSAFDMEYPHDILMYFDRYLEGVERLSLFTEFLNYQEHIFPSDYNKIRFIENHDTQRASARIQDTEIMKNWLAFAYFQKGTTLLYAGQEWQNTEYSTLFEKVPICRNQEKDVSPFIAKLGEMKKRLFPVDANFLSVANDDTGAITAMLSKPDCQINGLFLTKSKDCIVMAFAPDGEYTDEISGEKVIIKDGCYKANGKPVILRVR